MNLILFLLAELEKAIRRQRNEGKEEDQTAMTKREEQTKEGQGVQEGPTAEEHRRQEKETKAIDSRQRNQLEDVSHGDGNGVDPAIPCSSGRQERKKHLLGSVVAPLIRKVSTERSCPFKEGDDVVSRTRTGIKGLFAGRTGKISRIFEEFGQAWCLVSFPSSDGMVRFSPTELAHALGGVAPKSRCTETSSISRHDSSSIPEWAQDPNAFMGVRVRLSPSDPRSKHIKNILKSKEGGALKVGLVGGGIGYATVRWSETLSEKFAEENRKESSGRPEKRAKLCGADNTSEQANAVSSAAGSERQCVYPSRSDEKIQDSKQEKPEKGAWKKRKKDRERSKRELTKKSCTSKTLIVTFGRLDPGPELPKIHVLLAHPRPKVLAKLWAVFAQLGVCQIVVINAAKCEKQYWYSDKSCLKEKLRIPLLAEGLQQGGHTRMPNVRVERFFKPFMEEKFKEAFPEDAQLLLCDLGMHPCVRDVVKKLPGKKLCPVVLAIGPEGGWTNFEVEMLKRKGFKSVSLGPVIMRVDVACVAAIAVVLDQLNFLMSNEESTPVFGVESAATEKRGSFSFDGDTDAKK